MANQGTKQGRGAGPQPTPITDPIEHKLPPIAPPDSVCLLRVYGGTLELPLSLSRGHWSLGSGRGRDAVDLVVPGPHVSRLHAQIERQQTWLAVTNHSSNGCYKGGAPFSYLPIHAGQVFTVGTTELLALDEHLLALRRQLAWHLGFAADGLVDEALTRIADLGQPALLLTGPKGSDALTLARAIWRHSSRREAPFVEVRPELAIAPLTKMLTSARNGLVCVDITGLRGKRASQALVAGLFGNGAKRPMLRPVIIASSAADYRTTFDRHGYIAEIAIPSVASRPADVARLLDESMVWAGSSHRVAELGPARVAALEEFDWSLNLDDITRSARRIAAYLAHDRNLTAAASSLEVNEATLRHALARIGAITTRGGGR